MALVLVCVFAAWPALAQSLVSPKKENASSVPEDVIRSLDALEDAALERGIGFDPASVAPLLDYVASKGAMREGYDLGKRDGQNGIIQFETVRVPLRKILRYGYDPGIPEHLTRPSVLRFSGWRPGSDMADREVRLWEHLDRLDKPLILTGVQYEEITPDSSTGAYYRYDMDRFMMLWEHGGRPALISVARQKGDSSVGRKGVVVDNSSWDYVYMDEEGLTTGAGGWMDTHMYASFSAAVYMEVAPGLTSMVIIKWLKAGWAGLNVVRSSHIREGTKRFLNAFRGVMESELPPAADIAELARSIRLLSEADLDRNLAPYARSVEALSKSHPVLSRRSFASELKDGGYLDLLTREDKVALLTLECFKSMLGMDPAIAPPGFSRCGDSGTADAKPAPATPEAAASTP